MKEVNNFNVVKGFLNLSISSEFWIDQFKLAFDNENFGVLDVNKDS